MVYGNRDISTASRCKDETLARPLSSLPLSLITTCEPKGGGKHEGKFYVHTSTRLLKLVAPDGTTMAEWVAAINAARVAVHTLPSGKSTRLASEKCAGGEDGDAGGEAVHKWEVAHADGEARRPPRRYAKFHAEHAVIVALLRMGVAENVQRLAPCAGLERGGRRQRARHLHDAHVRAAIDDRQRITREADRLDQVFGIP